jgi:hypothetical protein
MRSTIRLRTAPTAGDLDAFEALVGRMTADSVARERAQLALDHLQDPQGYDIWWLATPGAVEQRQWYEGDAALARTSRLEQRPGNFATFAITGGPGVQETASCQAHWPSNYPSASETASREPQGGRRGDENHRSALSGSRLAARRAGIQIAASAQPISRSAPIAMVAGSRGSSP